MYSTVTVFKILIYIIYKLFQNFFSNVFNELNNKQYLFIK